MFDVPASVDSAFAETTSFNALTSLQSTNSPKSTETRPASGPAASKPTASGKKDPDALAAEITTLAGHLNAAHYRFLKLLDVFDREQGWAGPGVRSLAHWLSWKCGIGELVAREKVRVARALRELPTIDASFERGEISYSKVRAMTRAATPGNEAQLLNIARHGTAEHIERLVRVYRRCRKQAETSAGETGRRREERFYCFDEDDETTVFGGRVSAEQGRLLMKALDAMVAEMEADEREAGDAPQADDTHRAVDTHQADDEPDARYEPRVDEIGKADRPGKAGHHSPNDLSESAENVSAETSATGFGASVSAETSVPGSGAGGSSVSSAPAPGRNVSAETSVADSRKNVSAETSMAASGKNVSAETFSDGRSGVEPHEPHEPHEPDRPPLKPLRVRRATALAQIAEHYLATRSRNSGATPLRSSDAYQVFVHVNANDAHPDNRLNGGHTTYTDDRRCLAPHVAKQLACDASRRTVLENERGEVLNIGRRSRIVPWHIAHALRIRDGGCRFPGCNRHRWTDAHHIRHWADGGETSLENLVTLCRYHHRELHRGEYRIEHGADGELIFMDAQQRAIPPAIHPQFGEEPGSGGAACVAETPETPDASGALGALGALDAADAADATTDASTPVVTTAATTAADRLEQLQAENRVRGVEIDKSTAVTRWAGERMDYSTAIEWLMNRDGIEV